MTDKNIIYPTIDLFSYDLAEVLGESENDIEHNRSNFWRRIYGERPTDPKLVNAESELSDYIELLGKDGKDFDFPLDGFYYPVKLNDTYALQVKCSNNLTDEPPLKYSPRHIESFQKIQQNIIDKLHHSQSNQPSNHIGQTWFVWGQLTAEDEDAVKIARKIYDQLKLKIFDAPNWDKDLKTEITYPPKLLSAQCFELWQLPSDRGNISQSKHLLICLFPHELDIQKDIVQKIMPQLYPSLIQLFLYRHKIIWTYCHSRTHKNKLKEKVIEIQKNIAFLRDENQPLKSNLVQLQQDLQTNLNLINIYSQNLVYLESQKNTIETNLKNYQNKLKRLENPERDINIPFLFIFASIVTKKYIPQINADITSLRPNQKSLENAIRYIEGVISIEQARSERSLNQTIFSVGTGLGTSQVAAGVIVAQFPAISKDKPNYPPAIYMSGVFFISIAIGAVFGFLIWSLVRSRNSKKL